MTVSNTVIKARAVGDGANKTWPFNFLIPDAASFKLIHTDLTTSVETLVTSNYTVTGLNDADGGEFTYPVTGDALTSDESFTIKLQLAYTQPTKFIRQGRYSAPAAEAALDRLARLVLQLLEASSRAVQLPESSALASVSLPLPDAGKTIVWNEAEDGFENEPLTVPDDVVVNSFWEALIEGTEDAAALLVALSLDYHDQLTVDVDGNLTVGGALVSEDLTLTVGATVAAILDEDDLDSDSAVALATQQSIKAYVDALEASVDASISGLDEGLAKAWASVDRSAGTPTLESPSHNITSVTDDGAGNTTVTIADDFSSAVFAIQADTRDASANYMARPHSVAAGAFDIQVFDTGGAAQDAQDFTCTAFGAQA